MHGRSRRTRAWQGHARARGHTTRMRVATNRAGILLAIMRPGQLKKVKIKFEAVFQSAYFFINKFIINYDLNFYSLTFWSSNGQFHQIELEKSAIAKRWQIVELLNDSL